MVQYIEKYKRNIAVDMRKKGFPYSEIKNRLGLPKSTLSFWLKKIKLTEEQKKKINAERLKAIKISSEKRTVRTSRMIEDIRKSSATDIKEVSKKELWLMGVVLYWRERFLNGNESDLRKGVRFTSSDPYLIKLFLKWLQDVGQIKDEEIMFDIFIETGRKDSIGEVAAYWSDVTEFPESSFTRVYYLRHKTKRKRGGRKIANKTKFGLLRIRVRSSSMLARQIAGWVRGMIEYYWK